MSMRDKQQQTKFNFYTNIVALVANVLVGVYYTPYLLNSLGLAAYGILPLALIINQYISVATQTLTHAYTRFYSVALQKGDYEEASRDISTSLVVVLLLCVLIVPIGFIIVCKADSLFQIPSVLLKSAQYLFGYTILSFIISLLSSLLNVTLYAINRLDLMNVLKIIRTVFKLIVVVIFFETIRVDVSFVGLTNLITEGIILILSILLFFKYKPHEVHISLTLFTKSILYAIMGMSVWVLIQLCGDTLLYRTDNLIINHYWGIEASGALGAISEIGNYVTVVVSVIGSLFGPLILMAYAKGEHSEVKSLFVQQSTIVGCLSAILTGIIAGFGACLLDIWLGNGMGQYSSWLLMKMIVLPFYAAGGIMAFVYRSWNRMIFPAIGTIALGIVDVLTLIILCEMDSINTMSVLIISAFFSILQCFILNAVAVGKIYPDCRKAFSIIFTKIIVTFMVCYIAGRIVTSFLSIVSLLQLGVILLLVGSIMLFIVLLVVLSKKERRELLKIIH